MYDENILFKTKKKSYLSYLNLKFNGSCLNREIEKSVAYIEVKF